MQDSLPDFQPWHVHGHPYQGRSLALYPGPIIFLKKSFFTANLCSLMKDIMMFDVVVGIGDVIDKVQTSLESEIVRSTAAASEDLNL